MSLTGSQHQQVQAALLAAFDEQGLRELVKFEFDQDLDVIAAGNLADRTYALAAWADRKGQLRRLVEAACKENPGNPDLQLLAANLATWMAVEAPPEAGDPPYLGLSFYDTKDAARFFGRSELTLELVRTLQHSTLLVIVGASGSGKSSLARAGLIPALQCGDHCAGSARWLYRIMTPGTHPLHTLAAILTLADVSVAVQATLANEMKTDNATLYLGVAKLLAGEQAPHLFLLVDQFEETFTLCVDKEERRAFIANLLNAGKPDHCCTIVLTLRADYYSACAEYDEFRAALEQHQKYIGAMTRAELREIVEEPARLGNWDFEGGLVAEMLRDAGAGSPDERPEPSALPLLSHVLFETWQRRNGRTMTFAGYAAAGGVSGAIAKTAETVFSKQLTDSEQKVARRIFLRLVMPGDGLQDTRRRARLDELYPRNGTTGNRDLTAIVLDKLASARLVTTDSDKVEIVHEALIREWPALRDWLDDDREDLRLHRRLTQACEEWLASGGDEKRARPARDAALLWGGARLARAEVWATASDEDLSAPEQQFLAASPAQEQAAAREQRTRQLILRTLTVVALIFAVGAAWFGFRSLTQAREAESRVIAGWAVTNLATDPQLSVLLAAKALQRTYTAAAEDALRSALLQSRLVQRTPLGVERLLRSSFSSDHTLVALLTSDGHVQVRALPSGDLKATLPPVDQFISLTFAPRSAALLATGSAGGMVRLWDATSGKELAHLRVAPEGTVVAGLAFSPDESTRLATGGYDYAVRLWDIAGRGNLTAAPMAQTTRSILAVSLAFRPDGESIAAGAYDGTITLLDPQMRDLLPAWNAHNGVVLDVAFDPSGNSLASAGQDGQLLVWDTRDLALRALPVRKQSGDTTLTDLVFSPNGACLAAGGFGQKVLVWELVHDQAMSLLGANRALTGLDFGTSGAAAPEPGLPPGCGKQLYSVDQAGSLLVWYTGTAAEYSVLEPPASGLQAVAVDPHGQWLAAAGDTGDVFVWPASWPARDAPPRRLALSTGGINDLAASQDGRYLVAAGDGGVASVLDTATWHLVASTAPVMAHGAQTVTLRAVAFAPPAAAGSIFAAAQSDGAVALWQGTDGQLLKRWQLYDSPDPTVERLAFNSDGSLLLTGGADGRVLVWDVQQEKIARELVHAGSGIAAVAFSPDGRFALAGDVDGRVHIWSLGNGKETLVKSAHQGPVVALTFSPDGQYFATSSTDRTAVLWSAAEQSPLRTFDDSTAAVADVGFAAAGGMPLLLAVSWDAKVHVYVIRPEDLLRLAEQRMRGVRTLTPEECKQYLGTDDCAS